MVQVELSQSQRGHKQPGTVSLIVRDNKPRSAKPPAAPHLMPAWLPCHKISQAHHQLSELHWVHSNQGSWPLA